MVKKFFLVIGIIVIITTALVSEGYDFSIGGSYRVGGNFTYSNSKYMGLHQMITVPFIFSYYPGRKDIVSVGIKNKFGYGLNLYYNTISGSGGGTVLYVDTGVTGSVFSYNVKYDSMFFEHEVYENINFLMKIGGLKAKFLMSAGMAFKYSFVNVPQEEYDVRIHVNNDSAEADFNYLASGFHHYFSLGPSADLSLELINTKRNFSFIITTPLEFLIPITRVPHINVYSKKDDTGTLITKDQYMTVDHVNVSIGIEFIFSYYRFVGK